ncbi:MAG: deoxyribodipyrimidine photo-lyase [Candidatus Tumulicola sp.]
MAESRFIYRFESDLRLDDHAGLRAAASRGAVVPVVVVDPPLTSRLRRSPRRAAFFCAAIAALDNELRDRGSRLIVRRGPAGAVLKTVAAESGATGVAWSVRYGAEAVATAERLQSELEESGYAVTAVHDAPAIPPEETAAAHSGAGEGYRAFAPYFEVWRELPVLSHEHPLLLRFVGDELASEALPSPGEFGAEIETVKAGSAAARDAFDRFLRDDAAHYAEAALLPAEDGTSRMSADLSFGTISSRSMMAAIRERLRDALRPAHERASLRAFLRSLARRDFLLQLAWFHPRTFDEPLQEKMRGFSFAQSHSALEAWRRGATGFPLVDAGIRQLRETGWMHPHVRAVAASFLCFDLGVDWRIGRDEWDALLVEDDDALATGDWQWIAGVGADMAQYPRIYNPERQRRRIDADGRYVRRWIPELERVPVAYWNDRASRSPQLALELSVPGAYPQAVIDHGEAARAFLARYRAFLTKGSL